MTQKTTAREEPAGTATQPGPGPGESNRRASRVIVKPATAGTTQPAPGPGTSNQRAHEAEPPPPKPAAPRRAGKTMHVKPTPTKAAKAKKRR